MTDPTLPPDLALDEDIPEWVTAPDGPPELVDAWMNSDQRAEWAMRDLVRAQQRIIDAKLQRDAWVQRIDMWYEDVTATDVGTVARNTRVLERYAIACRAADPNRKTVTLPSGEITTRRATEPRVEIVDEKAVLLWARERFPDDDVYETFVRVTHSPLVSTLRTVMEIATATDDAGTDRFVVDSDGELVPGVEIVDPVTTATVKPRH